MTSDAESSASPDSAASPDSPASPGSPDSAAGPGSPASAASPATPVEPVDTEPLERSRRAIDEGHEAAARALNPPPDEQDLDFANVKVNDEPDSSDNAVPRPN